jgi:peptide/nickel transport system permease protein
MSAGSVAPTASPAGDPGVEVDRGGAWQRIRRVIRRLSVVDRLSVLAVLVIILAIAVGPLFAPDITESHIELALEPPSAAHWLGTDQQGRDVLWRIVVGARVSILSATVVVVGYGIVGVVVATVASFGPRWLDEAMMRVTDTVLGLPGLVLALAVAAALGPSLRSAIIGLIAVAWTLTARLMRATMRETMAMPFVEGARALGVSRLRLVTRHVLPNAMPPVLVKLTGDIGITVLVIGGLSFIGAGAQPPSPELGAMVSDGQAVVTSAWWVAFFPGLAIALTTAAFSFFGDALHAYTTTTGRGATP